MTQEALKLALDALETELSIDWTNNDEFNASAEKMHEAIAAIKEALAKEKALQALHSENERLGLYKDAYKKRTWVGLTDDEEMESTFLECGGKWNGDFWKIEDADFHPFLRTIEAKLKEKNCAG